MTAILNEAWLTSYEAAEIISQNSNHQVSHKYVQLLGRRGAIRMEKLNPHASVYHRQDCQKCVVQHRPRRPVQS